MASGQIKIKDTTKLRIDALKHTDTYDSFIDKMLSYFESTGIMPTSKIVSPVAAMREEAERIIKVIRGIEKSEGVTLKAIYDSVKNLSFSGSGEHRDTVNFTPEEMEKVNAVIDHAQHLEKENAGYISEIKELRQQLDLARQEQTTTAGTDTGINVSKVREILDVLNSKKKTTTFNTDIYEIPRNDFDIWMKRLKDELK